MENISFVTKGVDMNFIKKLTISLMTVLVTVCLLSCSKKNAENSDSVKYTFGGSSTVAPIVNEAIGSYEKKNTGVSISYETLGSSVGIKQLGVGTLSLAASSRDLKQSELDKGYVPHTIALDGLSIAVNKDVDINDISMETLAKIFSGEITSWKDINGKDEKIECIMRDETSGTYSSFNEIVMAPYKKEVKRDALVARENGESAIKIASTPGSIGYIGMSFGKIVEEYGGKILSVDGVLPTSENVRSKKYPISRALYLVTNGKPSEGIEKSFIDYVLSAEGQTIVENNGFIRVN